MKEQNDEELGNLRHEVNVLFASLDSETERGLVLAAAAFFDQSLKHLLKSYFVCSSRNVSFTKGLFETYGPLSTFSGKIRIAYGFRLISEEVAHDLDVIRKIRNDFAHSLEPQSLGSEQVLKLINSLQVTLPDMTENPVRMRLGYSISKLSGLIQAAIIVVRTEGISSEVIGDLLPKFGARDEKTDSDTSNTAK